MMTSDCECFIYYNDERYNVISINTVPFVLSHDANLINGSFLFHIRMVGTKQIYLYMLQSIILLHILFLHTMIIMHIAVIIYAVCCGLQTKYHGYFCFEL